MRFLVASLLLVASVCTVASDYKIYHLDLDGECVDGETVHGIWELWASSYGTSAFRESLGDYDVTDGSGMSPKSRFALEQLELTVKFFEKELDWNVIGGREKILLVSNFESGDGGGCSGLNAFYNGYNGFHLMGIELGHQNSRQSMADDLDNASHEYGHGYYREYKREQTHEDEAINESVADMFGAAFKAWAQSGKNLSTTRIRENTFWVGEVWAQLVNNYYGGNVQLMRDMTDPASGGDPDYYDRREAANTEIHSLGGVTNLAFALMAQGGTHPTHDTGINVQGIGMEKSIKLVAYILKHRIPFNSMPEFGDAMRKGAMRIHGRDSQELRSVDAAFRAVGLNSSLPEPRQEPATDTTPEETVQEQGAQRETPTAAPRPTVAPTPIPDTHGKLTITGPTFIIVLLAGISLIIAVVVIIAGRRTKSIMPMVDEAGQAPPPPGPNLYKKTSQPSAEKVATEKITPVKVVATEKISEERSAAIEAVLAVGGQSFPLELDATQLILGRSSELDLPSKLLRLLGDDTYISRKHCAIWYKSHTGELYVQSVSDNGVTVNGNKVSGKAKLKFNRPISIKMGKTTVDISPA
ncbi:M4 family metallopeptidase [Teredinibacter purpureus]|uniref:M4 family metallopeptidase n=1 Tax=Teredinibacter purpureus TaxID=2731756 RepID=UPI0005F7B213|nr:M4 family metallopeptidase [Teredinibacter purpureus]